MGGGAGTGEGVEDDIVWICCLLNQFLQEAAIFRKIKAQVSPDVQLFSASSSSKEIFTNDRRISSITTFKIGEILLFPRTTSRRIRP